MSREDDEHLMNTIRTGVYLKVYDNCACGRTSCGVQWCILVVQYECAAEGTSLFNCKGTKRVTNITNI